MKIIKNHMVTKFFCLAVLGITFLTSSAIAMDKSEEMENSRKAYVRADFGYSYIGKVVDKIHHSKKLKGAWFGSAGVGYVWNPHFKTDITGSYRDYKYKGHAISVDSAERQKVSSISCMINGYVSLKNIVGVKGLNGSCFAAGDLY